MQVFFSLIVDWIAMSPSPYSALSELLVQQGSLLSPAELHGLLLGRTVAGSGFDPASWLDDAAELLGGAPEEALQKALLGLQTLLKAELSGSEVTLTLLLPADSTPLAERAAALGKWCQGFLGGFGMAAGSRALSAEAQEVLQDIASIAQVQDGLADSEDGEGDYMQVMEYLRVAPLLLHSECVKAPSGESQKP